MDIIDAAVQRDIVLLLAVIVVALSGIVGFLFKLLLNEKTERTTRAEALTDKAIAALDKLADTTEAALDELRRK